MVWHVVVGVTAGFVLLWLAIIGAMHARSLR